MQKLYLKNRVLELVLIAFMLIGMGKASQALAFEQFQHADSIFNSLPVEVRMLNKKLDVNLLFSENTRQTNDDTYYLPDTVEVLSVQNNPRRTIFQYDNQANCTLKKFEKLENGEWFWFSYLSNTFDPDGNLMSSVTAIRENNAWVSVSKIIYTYTTNRKLKTKTNQIWDNGAWLNQEKLTNTWNSNGYLVAALTEVWAEDVWASSEFEIFVRNDDGSFLEYTKQTWDGTNWINAAHISNVFNNGLVETSTFQVGINNEWYNTERYSYSYNAQGQNTSYIVSVWADDQWIDAYKYNYTYNSLGYEDSGLIQVWLDNTWQNQTYSLYTLDGFGSLQSALTQTWSNNAWLNESLLTFDYDGNGNAFEGNYYIWDNDSWEQSVDQEIVMTYDNGIKEIKVNGYHAEASYFSMLVGNLENNLSEKLQFGLYPNPAATSLTIEVERNFLLEAVQIFDLTGKLIQAIELPHNVNNALKFSISVSDVPNGLYFVRAFGSGTTSVKKLIISR